MNGKNPGRSLTFEIEPLCKKSHFLLVLNTILLLLVTSCVQVAYETITLKDESDQSTVHRAMGNVLAGYPISQRISLNVERRVLPNGKRVFYCLLEYLNDGAMLKGWLSIQTGEPLLLRIDGQIIRLAGIADRYTRQTLGEQPSETAVYETPVELLNKLAEAREVIVRVRCSGQTIERSFGMENFRFLRRFVDEFGK